MYIRVCFQRVLLERSSERTWPCKSHCEATAIPWYSFEILGPAFSSDLSLVIPPFKKTDASSATSSKPSRGHLWRLQRRCSLQQVFGQEWASNWGVLPKLRTARCPAENVLLFSCSQGAASPRSWTRYMSCTMEFGSVPQACFSIKESKDYKRYKCHRGSRPSATVQNNYPGWQAVLWCIRSLTVFSYIVRCFIEAMASLGCWTDIQAVHVRVSKPWLVAAGKQFDESKKKHKTYVPKMGDWKALSQTVFFSLQEARSLLVFQQIDLLDVFPSKKIFKFQFPSSSSGGLGMGWYFTIGAHQTKAAALEMEKQISETQLWTEFGRRMPWDGCCCDGRTPISGV